ncbi:hypothetical protein LZ30DRAFT_580746 [Colletotrichum cereale]|nr:hypothetical protein LZ30DRAFT_580746 [Colletotrichum cereale]
MYRQFLGLAIFALATCVVGRGVNIHPEPLSIHPSVFPSKNGVSKDPNIRLRSYDSQLSHRSSFSRVVRPRDNAPFELGAVECNDPKDPEYKYHPDINSIDVDKSSTRFCESELARSTLTTVDDVRDHPLHAWRWRYKDYHQRLHDYKVHWRVNCRTKQGFQDIEYPLGPHGPSCVDIMRNNYRNCNNGGIGGSTQAGCLVYTLNTGRWDKYY